MATLGAKIPVSWHRSNDAHVTEYDSVYETDCQWNIREGNGPQVHIAALRRSRYRPRRRGYFRTTIIMSTFARQKGVAYRVDTAHTLWRARAVGPIVCPD